MEAWFEKNNFNLDFPFELFNSKGNCPVLHHWHDEVEIIYILNDTVAAGVNSRMYDLNLKDILIISAGDIHCFLPAQEKSNRLVIKFNLSIFDSVVPAVSERKEIRKFFEFCKRSSREWPAAAVQAVEENINRMAVEYLEKKKGYKLALKALLYDFLVILFREIPSEVKSDEELGKKREALTRLENVFQYVDKNYVSDISLKECAEAAGFSIYHFSRFFKQNTGITFNEYLSNYRITRAEWLLMENRDSITEIALSCGFNSVKTFDRVFKNIKGQSPSQFRKKQNLRTI